MKALLVALLLTLSTSAMADYIGDFTTTLSVDPFTDVEIRKAVTSNEITNTGVSVKVLDGAPFIAAVWLEEYLGEVTHRKVLLRFDSQAPLEVPAYVGESAVVFIDLNVMQIPADPRTLTIRVTDYRGDDITTSFEVKGLQEAISWVEHTQ